MNIKILNNELTCPISKEKTLSFRKYFTEKYIIDNNLTESPQNIGRRYPDILDNLGYNKEDTLNTMSNGEYIESISLYNTIIDVYVLHETEYYFIDKKNMLTIAYVFIETNNIYTKITGLWKYKAYKTIMNMIFSEYIIPKFKFVVSDQTMSIQGINFWKEFTITNFEQYDVGYIINDTINKIYNISDVSSEKYWSNSEYLMYIKER